jgi:hypothetical protein
MEWHLVRASTDNSVRGCGGREMKQKRGRKEGWKKVMNLTGGPYMSGPRHHTVNMPCVD